MSGLIRNIILALGLALIAWLGYKVFLGDVEEIVAVDVEMDTLQRDAQTLLVNLRQVQSINLSGSIFSDPRFQSLVDVRQEITDEPIGRDNPFMPTDTEAAE